MRKLFMNLGICILGALACFIPRSVIADTLPKATGDATVLMSTQHDFEQTMISGKMKSPDGFLIQGRTPQKMKQMIKLRKNFRSEIQSSRKASI